MKKKNEVNLPSSSEAFEAWMKPYHLMRRQPFLVDAFKAGFEAGRNVQSVATYLEVMKPKEATKCPTKQRSKSRR